MTEIYCEFIEWKRKYVYFRHRGKNYKVPKNQVKVISGNVFEINPNWKPRAKCKITIL